MLGALGAVGKVFGAISDAIKLFFGWAIYRAGQQNQASKDQAETLKTVIAERDAVDTADSAEDAAREGRF